MAYLQLNQESNWFINNKDIFWTLQYATDIFARYTKQYANSNFFKPEMVHALLVGEFLGDIYLDCSLYSCYYLCQTLNEKLEMNSVRFESSGSKSGTLEQLSKLGSFVECPSGHFVLAALSNDMRTECFEKDDAVQLVHKWYDSNAKYPMYHLRIFDCDNGLQHVSYSLVCDHRRDCADDSDENFCHFPICNHITHFECDNKECFPWEKLCDESLSCWDMTDEKYCLMTGDIMQLTRNIFSQFFSSISTNDYYRCADSDLRLPVYLVCNGVYDCPGKEDEAACDSYTCPGYYRCRNSTVCAPVAELCNNYAVCPQLDDEWFCDIVCPSGCTCFGWYFTCRKLFDVQNYTDLRYLDANHSGIRLQNLTENSMLIYLSLTDCQLIQMDIVILPNLRSLDLSNNFLSAISIDDVVGFANLRVLTLSGNPIISLFSLETRPFQQIKSLTELHLSRVAMIHINLDNLSQFPSLRVLNATDSKIQHIEGVNTTTLPSLRVLDLRGCPVSTFPRQLFQDSDDLQTVYTDNYKLCCPVMLPLGFDMENCHARFNEISSCDNLLRSEIFLVSLIAFAILSLVGNIGSLLFRALIKTTARNTGFGVFVFNLCASDLLMGIYLVIIGVADRLYQNDYFWRDTGWRHSAVCSLAGFLSFVSNEVSAFIICLITLDRFLVLRFPFSRLRFHSGSAVTACVLAWVTGIMLAAVPLLPFTSHWQFYSQTGICVPLPFSRIDFPGHDYAFTIMVIVNFVLFAFIATFQGFIYVSVHKNQMSVTDSSRRSQDKTLAARLVAIAMTELFTQLPTCLVGLAAFHNKTIPSEVQVFIAIFVLPLNCALNPFIYTFNVFRARRQKEREIKLLAILQGELKT